MGKVHWERAPAETLGSAVAAELLVARTRDTACLVRHIAASPDGMYFLLVVRLREPMPATKARSSNERFFKALDSLWFVRRKPAKSSLLFHVRFSDGREFWPHHASRRLAPGEVYLQGCGGEGDASGHEMQFRLDALPPPGGSVTFVCTWESRGIVDSQAELAADLILASASKGTPIFSDSPRASPF